MDTLTLNRITLGRPTDLPALHFEDESAADRISLHADELYRKLKDQDTPEYEPALKAVHSRSRGMAQRILSAHTHREHHLLSRNERGVFLLAEFDKFVINIREQFALPLPLTEALAKMMGIRHPAHDGNNVAVTTDFVFTLDGGSWVAVDFKQEKDLSPRALEKLQLAAGAFAQVRVPHYTVTEHDLPYRVIQNLRWLHIYRLNIDPPPIEPEVMQKIEPELREILSDGKTMIFDAATRVAGLYSLPPAKVARACYWLTANVWPVDISKPIGPDYPVCFQVN